MKGKLAPETKTEVLQEQSERSAHETKIRQLEGEVMKLTDDLNKTRTMLGKALMQLAEHDTEFKF